MRRMSHKTIADLMRLQEAKKPVNKDPVEELTTRICYFCKKEGYFIPVNGYAESEGRFVIVMVYKGTKYVREKHPVCNKHSAEFNMLLGTTIWLH